ncbi:MAG: GNAT family N-acetyltransferase [Flavobacteriaceae bacterium]|jgi:aminoglycoside 6'-N-acetyltransferase I|nr:GNAT family N-acetyltransferase [Flavobacteriaceae bacterium]
MFVFDKTNYSYSIVEIVENKKDLYHLLLLADETTEAIDKYLLESTVYVINDKVKSIGVFCLYKIDDDIIELKNIAVDSIYQSKGIGGSIITCIKEIVKEQGYKVLVVGTADTGEAQIRFYLRNGFIKTGLKKDFFLINYSEPIFENGVQLRDMVMFETKV